MYLDSSTSKGKYTRHLLRESYREGGKVKHRTIANLSQCSEEEIESIRLALKHKNNLVGLTSVSKDISLVQGLPVGAVWLVHDIAKQIGIAEALGSSREGKLALWQVIARVIDQGSRLSAIRLAQSHAACEVLGIDGFNEEHLYRNLDWLCDNQKSIENQLFLKQHSGNTPNLFLYDVTSSYFEGTQNELAAFGYNRDGKKGKKQIVVGLLCDESGKPLSVEVFPGNTNDTKTFGSQIRKVVERFGGKEVTFVGDRGMIKSAQVRDLLGQEFHYVTAITKPQIENLLKRKVIQMSLFDQELAEITDNKSGIRYVLRRNPMRSDEIRRSRENRLQVMIREVGNINKYLRDHPRAKEEVALRKLNERCAKLKLSKWVSFSVCERKLLLTIDEDSMREESKLDGCYVLKTDLKKEIIDKETIHSRYKDLSLVEWAFRISKTVELEMRPIHVRLSSRTRGHALVVMPAYGIVKELSVRWRDIDMTVNEGIQELGMLCMTEIHIKGKPGCNKIPEPRPSTKNLLDSARVRLPEVLPKREGDVATNKKLTDCRKRQENQYVK